MREEGIRNEYAYLVSDHLDVYIATSMRRRHEYVEVAESARQLFSRDPIGSLDLRWFDPTHANCSDRIDKGLAEALTLKRAKCMLYLAQESDTLGKESELASTLGHGKPVIACVPSPTDQEVLDSVKRLSRLYSRSEASIVLERLQALNPSLARVDAQVRRWLDAPREMDRDRALELLVRTAREHYDKRAETLIKREPPFGDSGESRYRDSEWSVGYPVVSDCAELIHRIVTRTLTNANRRNRGRCAALGDCGGSGRAPS